MGGVECWETGPDQEREEEKTIKAHSSYRESFSPPLVEQHTGGGSSRSWLQAETRACCPTWKIWHGAERESLGEWCLLLAPDSPLHILSPLLSGLFSIPTFRNPINSPATGRSRPVFLFCFVCFWFINPTAPLSVLWAPAKLAKRNSREQFMIYSFILRHWKCWIKNWMKGMDRQSDCLCIL